MDAVRLRRLSVAGLSSLEDVVRAGPSQLAALTGFDRATAHALVRVAEGALVQMDPRLIEFVPLGQEAPTKRLARGLEGARNIEVLRSQVRKVRSHLGRRPARIEWRKSHKRARKQLARLLQTLEALQRDVLSSGLSSSGFEHLQRQLEPLRAQVELAVDESPRKRLFKRLRKAARRARTEIEER